jgi:hypothetical protein
MVQDNTKLIAHLADEKITFISAKLLVSTAAKMLNAALRAIPTPTWREYIETLLREPQTSLTRDFLTDENGSIRKPFSKRG